MEKEKKKITDETSEDKWRTDAHLEDEMYDYAGNIREDEGEETPLEHGERMESIRDSLREDGYESL